MLNDTQITTIGNVIYNTCRQMGVFECNIAQSKITEIVNKNPSVTKNDIIIEVFNSLKHNMVSNISERAMYCSFGDPNSIHLELTSNLTKALNVLLIDLKDASDETKASSGFVGSYDMPTPSSGTDFKTGDIVYVDFNGNVAVNEDDEEQEVKSGYYEVSTDFTSTGNETFNNTEYFNPIGDSITVGTDKEINVDDIINTEEPLPYEVKDLDKSKWDKYNFIGSTRSSSTYKCGFCTQFSKEKYQQSNKKVGDIFYLQQYHHDFCFRLKQGYYKIIKVDYVYCYPSLGYLMLGKGNELPDDPQYYVEYLGSVWPCDSPAPIPDPPEEEKPVDMHELRYASESIKEKYNFACETDYGLFTVNKDFCIIGHPISETPVGSIIYLSESIKYRDIVFPIGYYKIKKQSMVNYEHKYQCLFTVFYSYLDQIKLHQYDYIEYISDSIYVHDYIIQTIKDATCLEDGEMLYSCKYNDETHTEKIPALGHDYGNFSVIKPANCIENGLKTCTCKRCRNILEQEIPKLESITIELKDASSEYKSNYKYIGATEIFNGDITWQEGNSYLTTSCRECKDIAYSASYSQCIFYASVSDYSDVNIGYYRITKPKATNNNKIFISCDYTGEVCVEYLGASYKIEQEPHTYVDFVKAATCTEAGIKYKYCSVCNKQKDIQNIAALGHSYTSAVTKQPTTTEKGIRTYTCQRCGNSYTEEIPVITTTKIELKDANYTIKNKYNFYSSGLLTKTNTTPSYAGFAPDGEQQSVFKDVPYANMVIYIRGNDSTLSSSSSIPSKVKDWFPIGYYKFKKTYSRHSSDCFIDRFKLNSCAITSNLFESVDSDYVEYLGQSYLVDSE